MEAIKVRVRYTEIFRLAARVGSHAGKSVGGACHARHDGGISAGGTEASETALAVAAETPADVEGQHDVIAFLHGIDRFANLHYLTEIFVAQYLALFHIGTSLIHMQVRAADIGGGELDDDVSLLLDLGIGDRVNTNFLRPVINDCFHRKSLLMLVFGLKRNVR